MTANSIGRPSSAETTLPETAPSVSPADTGAVEPYTKAETAQNRIEMNLFMPYTSGVQRYIGGIARVNHNK